MVLEVKGRHYDKVFLAYAENVSQGGLFFSSSHPLKVGDTFPVEFVLPDNVTTVACTCEVVWKKQYEVKEGISQGIGIKFLDLDEAKQRVIAAYVEERLKSS